MCQKTNQIKLSPAIYSSQIKNAAIVDSSLAGGKELVSVWSGHKPQRDDCEEKMQGETRAQEIKQMRDRKTCGETERDTGEAHVALIPRMRPDSGQLMTGVHRHSESERAGENPPNSRRPSH